MPERAFEIIDHTADVGIVAYGTDVKELFRNAALGLFSLVTDTRQIEESLRRDLKIASTDHVGLLVEWLNELIYLLDTEHILFNRFVIEQLTNDHLEATCYGEKVDPRRHEIRLGIKAATYHMLRISKNDGYKARVIFDV